ncbi:MAG: nucleotidyl transferase AbiEii/AbiGii toxin family protein [Candidatus Margulisiibacteriota bacterium]
MKKNDPLIKTLLVLKKLMDVCACPWTVIGGVAASLLGKPRFTADVDAVILIDLKEIPQIIKNAVKLGLKPRLKDAEAFAQKNRVLLLRNTENDINIDISLGLLPFEQKAIENSQKYKIGGLTINLPKVEDLIIFKAVAHRSQDLIDIQELVNANPKIDFKYIKKTLKEFASVLEMPEILADAEKIFTKEDK